MHPLLQYCTEWPLLLRAGRRIAVSGPVLSLMESIGGQGDFPGDPLLVSPVDEDAVSPDAIPDNPAYRYEIDLHPLPSTKRT